MDEADLRAKIEEADSNLMSIYQMGEVVDLCDSTGRVKATTGLAYFQGVTKLHAYLQLYNENFMDQKLKEEEENMRYMLDYMESGLTRMLSKSFDAAQKRDSR